MGVDEDIPSIESFRSHRILLCDDSDAERSILAHFLRRRGYEVREVDGGDSAIEFVKNNEVDLLLLDLQMPEISGFDVLAYLQEHRRGLPVILLSGMALDQIQQEIHSLPSHELPPLFLKPLDLDQLLQVLELQLSGGLPDLSSPTGTQDATM